MRQATRPLWVACALVALAFGCREDALTQIVVVVDSNWDGFSRIEMTIDGFERRHTVNAESRNGRLMLPRRVALVHAGGPLGPISVTARGYVAGRDDPALTEPRTKVFFERGKTRMLKIDLLFECIGQCPEACLAGPTCVDSNDERATALTPWEGDVDGIDVVYSVGRGDVIDSGVDGGIVPMPGEDGGVAEGGPEPTDAGDAGDGTVVTVDADATSPTDAFTYTPSNFDPGAADIRAVERVDVVLDCDGVATFDSSSLEFGQWCGAEPEAVMITQLGGTSAVVLVMETLTIAEGTTLELRGDQPVILAVFDRATIDGVVDASGHASANGPGAGRDCGGGAGTDGAAAGSSTGAGGGSGGGFGSAGGDGGGGGDAADGTSASSAVSGGGVNGSADLQPLRGGCPGGLGGDGAAGGGGGGAVQISVAHSLAISGTIHAGGGGGASGVTARDGGGGGGSGGAIVLEAATLETGSAAVITANGGAGGAGQPSTASTSGPGEDGQPSTVAASGGTPPSTAGGGGNGAVLGVAAEPGGNGGTGSFYGYGAGGGGGGVGRVRIRADRCAPPGVLSPAPSVECAQCGTCATAPGPDCEAFVHAGRTYYSCSAALDWDEARAVCEGANLNLVRIDDDAENAAVANAIAEDSWIGASDDVENDWRWTDGTAFWSGAADGEAVGAHFSAWYDQQPDNLYGPLTSADCAAILLDGTWGDRTCLISHPYVCEE